MYQQTVIAGNLGRDPELRYTPSGVAVCDFSVATNKRWKDGDGNQQEKVTWFRVTTWRGLAETCNEYLQKGSPVLVSGEIDASAWASENGEPRVTLELTAREVRFLGRSKGNGGHENPNKPGGSDAEIPF